MYSELYKTFYYETFTYHLFSSKQSVVHQLDELFAGKKGLFKSPNLAGKFVNYPDTFYIAPRWWLMHIRNFEGEPAILKGVITKKSATETIVEIAVRPDSIFLILLIFFLPFGFYNLYMAIMTKDLNSTAVGLCTVVVVLPILFWHARRVSKNLRKSFERYMSISHRQK